jgi:cobalt-precorrin 5A hydrolase
MELRPMIVAGVGCRSECDAQEIVRLVQAALRQAAEPASALAALAVPDFKAEATAPREAADALGLPLLLISERALQAASPRCMTSSAIAQAATGLASVAESAALAAAGMHATLILPRIKSARVTCALARAAAP